MTTKGREIIIEGEAYIDSRAVLDFVSNVINEQTLRELGKNWKRQKVGNRYFYRKADVKLPHYPLAKWQRLALMYMALLTGNPNEPGIRRIMERDDYYHAAAFLLGAEVEKLVTGWLPTEKGRVDFALLADRATGSKMNLVVSDNRVVAGRALSQAECNKADIVTRYRTFNMRQWNTKLFTEIAEELLSLPEVA